MSEVIDAAEYPRLAARLKLAVPKERVAQIHEFAADLAVGFNEGAWSANFMQRGDYVVEEYNDETYRLFFENKWREEIPYMKINTMISMGYLQQSGHSSMVYVLTEKAFRLVDEPVSPPDVFISYKRSESSAFALLLEARIRYETNATPFLDKSIEPGDDWHPLLEAKVKSCEAFICVIAPKTLDSQYVRNEIRWARDNGKNTLMLPVWHNGYDGSHEKDLLTGKQAVIVGSETAKDYESAVSEILNRLGYSPHFIARRQAGSRGE